MTETLHRVWAKDLDAETLYKLLQLRIEVFVVEQAIPYPELDGRDLLAETRHFWLETPEREVICTLRDPRAPALAEKLGTTRTAAALDFWIDRLAGSVVAIGNAPTALFRLLELIDVGAPKPAAILGIPVGFVGAAEAKDALAADSRGVPFLIVRGRMGGSAMTAAAPPNPTPCRASNEKRKNSFIRARRRERRLFLHQVPWKGNAVRLRSDGAATASSRA